MKKIVLGVFVFCLYQMLCSQELEIVVLDSPPFYEFQDLNLELFLHNNTSDTLVYFDSRGPSYESFKESWSLSANNKFLEVLPLNGAFEHKYSDSLFVTLLPGSKNCIRKKTLKLDYAGDYSFTYMQEQNADFISKFWADSTVTDSLIRTISTFKVSKNFKFDVYINFDTVIHEIVHMPWEEWKDFRHVQMYSRQKHFDNLEAAFSYPQDVYSLKVYGDALSENQVKQIGRLSNLRRLELRNYTLDYFPEELVNLDLYELVLIPKEEKPINFKYGLSKNATLRELTTRFYDSVSSDLLKQEQLIVLDISHSNLASIPALGSLKNLKKLVLDNNKLVSVDRLQLETLPQLIDLNLSGNKQIDRFGKILDCENLEFLTINRTRIDSIPDEIECLSKMKQLSVSNKLVFVSDSIGKLNDMRILSFGGNTKLNYLPASIIKMTKLLQLNINRTAIAEFPEGISDLPLEKLQIYDTPIKRNKDYWLLKTRLKEEFKD